MTDKDPNRPIDRIRNSALSMKIGENGDGPIGTIIDMQQSLYSVHEHAIFAIQIADQIDPQRTNTAIPNTQQKVLSLGAQDPEVARTYLTAYTLFKSLHLGPRFDEKKSLQLAFEFLAIIAAILDEQRRLDAATKVAVDEFEALPAKDRSLRLPALGDVSHRCNAFTQKIGHAVDMLEEIARLFYPGEITNKWVDSLAVLLAQKHGEDASVTRAMQERGPALLQLRRLRNMVEHPKDGDRIAVYDFKLLPSMELLLPSVNIQLPGEEPVTGSLVSLMEQVRSSLVDDAEHLFGLLVAANLQPPSKFNICLIELPEDRRPKWNPHQRLSYGIEINGQVQPLG
ncbi:MAG: hypothetical protein IPL58_06705 [Betaproteobacteria bacterium]|uniref:Uncharacterized protein n=1 Tax=Candidatus Proximibacter danicus TaxID=2954365 RepID=A0A9D7K1V3_9PROT|nr:hypothetical protein [Candidatus Proximibacter danicus]